MTVLSWKKRPGAPLAAVLALALLSGCASTGDPESRAPYDPFEPVNRQVWAFNQAVDRAVLRPAARAYDTVTPRLVQLGVSNVLDNLNTPIWMLNHLLQGNLKDAGKQTARFVLNSTLGVFGVFDPAGDNGLEKNRANFDQTFGKWGAPPGPFLMLPLLGPSSVRGGVAAFVRIETDVVWNYLDDNRSVRDKLIVLEIIDTRRKLLPLDRTMRSAPDSYIFVRDAYRQRVEFAIHGAGRTDDDVRLDFEDEDWGEDL